MTYKQRSNRSRLSLGFSFIGFVASLLIFGWLWRQAALSQWSGGADFSWVEQEGGNLSVHTFLPEYAKQINWQIPGNTLVETAFGYGRYQWKNVFALAQLDGRGGPVLTRTSQEVLGLNIGGWRVAGQTNLSLWDRLSWWYLTKFKTKQVITIDLSQTAAWQKETLPDGSPVWEVVEYQLDQIINQETFSQAIASEGLGVSLVNDQGLSRVITNHGIELVTVSQAELPEQTIISVKEADQVSSQTVKWLKRLIPQAEVKIGSSGDFWSAIVIVLGKDYN